METGDGGLNVLVWPTLVTAGLLVLGTVLVLYLTFRLSGTRSRLNVHALYQSLYTTAVDPVIVIDEVGGVVTSNKAAERMLGYAENELVGRNVRMLMPEPERSEHDGYLRNYRDTGIRKIIGIGREVLVRCKDGTLLPVGLAVSEFTSRGTRYFAGVLRDLSELYAERNFNAGVLETAAALVVVLDTEGRIVRFNRACRELTEYSFEEVRGRPLWDVVIPAAEQEAVRRVFGTLVSMDPDGSKHFQNNWRTKSGELRLIEWSNSVLADAGGRVVHVIGTGIDVTDRERVRSQLDEQTAELLRSNRDLEQFAYVASHDLQEPLRMVAGHLQVLERRYGGKLEEDGRDFVRYAVDGARRMQQLIADLLRFSRVGTRGADLQRVSIPAVLEATLANLSLLIEETGGRVDFPPDLPEVLGDRTQLLLLFQNVIGNALKFRGELPPSVEVTWQPEPGGAGHIRFSIADNGIGIEENDRNQIFVIFQRLHERGEYPGTGIGLALCRRVVERHGGRIWVDAREPQGSIFHFTLLAAGEGDR